MKNGKVTTRLQANWIYRLEVTGNCCRWQVNKNFGINGF